MNDKDLKSFIEKLIQVLTNNQIWLKDDIENFDKSIDSKFISEKLFEFKLVEYSSEIYDKLSERGLSLKKLGTFKKLEKFENDKPNFFTKYRDLIYFIVSFIMISLLIIPIYKSCTIGEKDEKTQSLYPKNQNTLLKDTDTINRKLDSIKVK